MTPRTLEPHEIEVLTSLMSQTLTGMGLADIEALPVPPRMEDMLRMEAELRACPPTLRWRVVRCDGQKLTAEEAAQLAVAWQPGELAAFLHARGLAIEAIPFEPESR